MLVNEILKDNKADCHGNGHYSITSTESGNLWTINVYKDAIYPETGTVWEWKIDKQYFSRDDWAAKYLVRLIAEKNTGERIIDHERGNVPDICGS